MLSNTAYGFIFGALALVSLIAFLFNLKALKRFDLMNAASKVVAMLIAGVTMGATLAFGYFSFNNFTYRAPQADEMTKQLQSQIEGVKKAKAKYRQRLSIQEYHQLSVDELYAAYSREGQKAIDNLSKDSALTKELFLRNVGVQYSEDGLITRQLKATNGRTVDMLDGKERVIIFADTTEFSAGLIANINNHVKGNRLSTDIVLVFPVTNGTDIDAFFGTYNSTIGGADGYNVISSDSLANMPNLNVKYLAVNEYMVQNLPSYLAVDANGVISNAGVGSLISSADSAAAWFSKAFTSEQKYYDLIQGLPGPEEETDVEASEATAEETSSSEETTEEGSNS